LPKHDNDQACRPSGARLGLEFTVLWIIGALFLQRQPIDHALDPATCAWGDPAIPARALVLLGMAGPLDCQALLQIDLWRALGLTLLVPLLAWLLVPPFLHLIRRARVRQG
jgi:hypothetical protein